MSRIRVMVVDDSAFMRRVISDILSESEDLHVIATARDGRDALSKLEKLKPDVITLDLEMPVLNGLEVLKEIMSGKPIPVVMLSSHTHHGSRATIDALALGAVDFVAKPAPGKEMTSVGEDLKRKIRMAARATFSSQSKKPQQPGNDSQAAVHPKFQCALVAIGASTGGPGALEKVLTALPADFPVPVIVTQHMPAGFTGAFADRLDSLCKIKVKEAKHGEKLQKGTAYIAPGGFHMEINNDARIDLNQNPPVEHVRPSVNVMLASAIKVYGGKIIGVILTGMGKDGADAMAALKKCGGKTVVQDETTSVIFSMPKAVIERNAADVIAPIQEIADILIQWV